MDNVEVKLEEYKMLRDEMLYFMNKDTTLFTCLFASVTAVLFFALEYKIPEGCFLAFLIIIPVGSKLAYHQREMAKISEYMRCHLEKDIAVKWETFLSELSIHQGRPKTARWMKFSECLMMTAGTVFTYAYLAWRGKIWKGQYWLFGVEVVILLLLTIWTLLISINIYKIKEYKNIYGNIINQIQI